MTSPGPWFLAAFASDCSWGDEIEEGDEIRADGEGGYEHLDCHLDNSDEEPGPTSGDRGMDELFGF